jgi:hypothetical protein
MCCSALNQRTFVDVLKINYCVFAQRLTPERLGHLQKLNRLYSCSALGFKAVGSLSKIKPISFLLSTELKAIGSLSRIKPIVFCSANHHHSDHLNQTNHSSFCVIY